MWICSFLSLTILAHQLGWFFLTFLFLDSLVCHFLMFDSFWLSNILVVCPQFANMFCKTAEDEEEDDDGGDEEHEIFPKYSGHSFSFTLRSSI